MSENQDSFYNLAQRIEDAFPEIDSDIVTGFFKSDSKYAALRTKIGELKKEYPVIEKALEDDGGITLSADEHSALVQYISISRQIDDIERQQIYLRGHTDSMAYLKKIGVI